MLLRIRRILLPAGVDISSCSRLFAISRPPTSHNLDLRNTVAVTENDTDLGGRSALPGELADLIHDLVRGGLEPGRRGARVGDGRGADALAIAVHTTHVGGLEAVVESSVVVVVVAGRCVVSN